MDGFILKGLEAYLAGITDGIEIRMAQNLGNQYFRVSIQKPYLSQLIKNLHERFEDKSIMAAFEVFNTAKLPQLSQESEQADAAYLSRVRTTNRIQCAFNANSRIWFESTSNPL